ncbi:hypothetical protein E4Q23_15060 [Candidatus Accumulibacter phosphatis]|jgi:hypothetical protein|uniref:Uncharacterized protein n=1 Tax=Candidatus Accumulibacter phosphatis TaxID=327160 RepID=A0ABX1TXG8_9PROT|nr:hypothetical protein [Candidatus Accumulibacter phosphatis]NMQ28964.1 hypothetical protein [Candidatus Accumulibacter phosphatis]
MTAGTILRDSALDGVTLSLSATGTIKAVGEQAVVTRWLAAIRENKAGIVALLSEDANQKPFAASRWLVHFADGDALAVSVSPAASNAEVLANYPGALAAEPIDTVSQQPEAMLTSDQEAAIVGWLTAIGEADQAIVSDVRAQCRHDDGARQYFLGRAGECATADTDDRRRCIQCDYLRSGVCVVAKPGGVVSAIRGYRPAPTILQRCVAFVPARQPANSL